MFIIYIDSLKCISNDNSQLQFPPSFFYFARFPSIPYFLAWFTIMLVKSVESPNRVLPFLSPTCPSPRGPIPINHHQPLILTINTMENHESLLVIIRKHYQLTNWPALNHNQTSSLATNNITIAQPINQSTIHQLTYHNHLLTNQPTLQVNYHV